MVEMKDLFPPEFATLIASGINRWSNLEYDLHATIWELADVRPALGACMTAQIFTTNAKLDTLLSLLKLRSADQKLIDRVNKFSSTVRPALEARNRMGHDLWLKDKLNPSGMGKLRITAAKKLDFKIETVTVEQLTADVEKIEQAQIDFHNIRVAILDAIPTLPEMSPTALHPISETLKRP